MTSAMNSFLHSRSRGRTRKLPLSLLALGSAVLLLASCGGGGSGGGGGGNSISNNPAPPVPSGQGSVVVFAGDAPLCDVMSMAMTITGMTMTPSSGGSPVSVISSSNPVTVDFAGLMGSSMMLGSASVPAGAYSRMTLTLANPQMGMLSSGSNGMGYGMMNSSLSSSSVTVNMNPALQVSANTAVGLMMDMSLLKSVVLSNNGTTATINPTLQAGGMRGDQGSPMMQGLNTPMGIVQSVNTTSSNSSFTGSFTIEQWMMGRTFTVNVTSQTSFQGVSGLSALAAGTLVAVQASVDSDGNLVAGQVDAEGQTNGQQGMGGFTGVITSITRNSSGNATQFQLGMNQEFPEMQSMMGLLAQPQITLASGATFQMEDPTANFAQLTFDGTTAGLGQMVTIMGQVTGQGSGGMMGGSGGMMGEAERLRSA